MKDLCRVYYGGFLQTQLADFFIGYYDGEPEEIRDLIVEKFLLTIRTEQIQQRVLDFFDGHYDALSTEQKSRFYTTFFEMLQEGDQLAEKLIRIVDKHITTEDEGFRKDFVDRLSSAVQTDMKRKQPLLLNVLFRTNGFCSSTVVSHILTEWSGRKVFTEYLANLSAMPVSERADSILYAFRTVSEISEDAAKSLSEELLPSFVNDAGKTDIYQLLDIDRRISAFLSGDASADARGFCEKLRTDAIGPAVLASVKNAFIFKKCTDGLTVIREYAENNPYLAGAAEYEPVRTYFELSDAVSAADCKTILACCDKLTDKTVRTGTADHLQAEWLYGASLADEKYDAARFLLGILVSYLKTDIPSASAPYQTLVTDLRKHIPSSEKPNPEQETRVAEEKAISMLLTLGGETYQADVSDGFRTALFSENSDTAQILSAFVRKYEKKGKKYLLSAISSSAAHETPYEKIAETIVNNTQPSSSGGFFAKLFGKK